MSPFTSSYLNSNSKILVSHRSLSHLDETRHYPLQHFSFRLALTSGMIFFKIKIENEKVRSFHENSYILGIQNTGLALTRGFILNR